MRKSSEQSVCVSDGQAETMNDTFTADQHPVEDHGHPERADRQGGEKTAGLRTAPTKKLSPPHGVEAHLVSLLTPASFEADQYRTLRYIVENLHKSAKLAVVAITSATPGDGKTITAINLAGALAQSPEVRILLVDADIRRPSVISYLGLPHTAGPGLSGAIQSGSLVLEQVVRRDSRFNFSVLPAGRPPALPYEILKSPRLEKLLEEARQRYDFVVLDMPPLVPIPDCRIMAKLVDGFLVVVTAHKTPRKLMEESLNIMDPSKVVGLVFNNDDRPLGGYNEYYSAYGSSPNGEKTGWWSGMAKKIHGAFYAPAVSSTGGRDVS